MVIAVFLICLTLVLIFCYKTITTSKYPRRNVDENTLHQSKDAIKDSSLETAIHDIKSACDSLAEVTGRLSKIDTLQSSQDTDSPHQQSESFDASIKFPSEDMDRAEEKDNEGNYYPSDFNAVSTKNERDTKTDESDKVEDDSLESACSITDHEPQIEVDNNAHDKIDTQNNKKTDESSAQTTIEEKLALENSRHTYESWAFPNNSVTICGKKLSRGYFYYSPQLAETEDTPIIEHKYTIASTISAENIKFDSTHDSTENRCFTSFKTLPDKSKLEYIKFLTGEITPKSIDSSLLNLYLSGIEYRLFVDERTDKDEKIELVKVLVSIHNERYKTELTTYFERPDRYYLLDIIDNALVCLRPDNAAELIGNIHLINLPKSASVFCNDIDLHNNKLAFNLAFEVLGLKLEIPVGTENLNIAREKFSEYLAKAISDCAYDTHGMTNRWADHSVQLGMEIKRRDPYYSLDNTEIRYSLNYPMYTDWRIFVIRRAIGGIIFDNKKYHELSEENDGVPTPFALMNMAFYFDPSNEPQLMELKEKIDKIADPDGFSLMKVTRLIDWIHYPNKNGTSIYKPHAKKIVSTLNKMGYGIAPNPNIIDNKLSYDESCCIYKTSGNDIISSKIEKMQVVAKIICRMDKTFAQECNEVISDYFYSEKLSDNEIRYITAFIKEFSAGEMDFSPQSKILKIFTPEESNKAYKFLLKLTTADGIVNTNMISELARYSKALGFNPKTIYSEINRTITNVASESPKKEDKTKHILKDTKRKQVLKFDEGRLHTIEEQTLKAREILSKIFTDDDKPVEIEPAHKENICTINEIISKLFTQEKWSYDDVKNMCREKGLMTGYILEKINDIAYKKVGDAAIEQEADTIFVTLSYKDIFTK